MNGTKECGEIFSHDPQLTIEGPWGNIYFRPMTFESRGDKVHGHLHNFDHVTYLVRGSVEVRVWKKEDCRVEKTGTYSLVKTPQGTKRVADVIYLSPPKHKIQTGRFSAPSKIPIPKDRFHEFTALEDDTYAECIYAVRDEFGQVTEHWDEKIMEPYR